jgi:hypothetical protein
MIANPGQVSSYDGNYFVDMGRDALRWPYVGRFKQRWAGMGRKGVGRGAWWKRAKVCRGGQGAGLGMGRGGQGWAEVDKGGHLQGWAEVGKVGQNR